VAKLTGFKYMLDSQYLKKKKKILRFNKLITEIMEIQKKLEPLTSLLKTLGKTRNQRYSCLLS